MGYLKRRDLPKIGLKSYGENVLISDRAVFYRPERISIGSCVKIDDNAVIANHVDIGDYVHISIGCHLLSSCESRITIKNFSGLAPRCHIFTASDDYSGPYICGPVVHRKFSRAIARSVTIEEHCIVGTMSMIFPGVTLRLGTGVGAHSVVLRSTRPWCLYVGSPACVFHERDKEGILSKRSAFIDEGCPLDPKFANLLAESESL